MIEGEKVLFIVPRATFNLILTWLSDLEILCIYNPFIERNVEWCPFNHFQGLSGAVSPSSCV